MARKKHKTAKNARPQSVYTGNMTEKPRNDGHALFRPLHIILLAALAMVIYANTLDSPFVWDEEPLITNNALVHNLGYFLNPGKAVAHPHYDALVNRYVSYLSFALNYSVGGTSVTGYRVVNIIIHALNAILAYLLLIMTFNTPVLRESPLKDRSLSIALLTGALFAAHPIMTEAIDYTFQRHASLVTTFYVMSIVLYSASRERESRALYIAAIVSAVLAMKTKENAFTLPLAIALYEFMFFRGNTAKRLQRLLPIVLTMSIIPLTLSYLGSLGTGPAPQEPVPAAAASHILGRAEYFYTQMPVTARYLRMLALPYGQSLDHDFVRYSSLLDLPVFLSMMLHVLIVGLALQLWRRSSATRPEFSLIAFGILWFYITLSVESTFQPLQMIITEYRVYLPATGIFLSASVAGTMAAVELDGRRPGLLRAARPMAIALIALLGVLAVARNSKWETELSIWQDAYSKNTRSARPALHVGLAEEKLGDYDAALKAYKRAAELEPDHYMAHYDLGVIYNNKGRYDMAEASFRRALEIKPNYPLARNNLAAVLMRMGRASEAEQELKLAISQDPMSPNPYFNLSLLLLNFQRYAEAEPYLMKLSTLIPVNADIINKLAVVYRETGRAGQARDVLKKGLASFPGDFHLLLNLAALEEKEGDIPEAESLYLRAISAAPGNGYSPYDALAGIYIRSGRNSEALDIIEKGLKRTPSDANLIQLRTIARQGTSPD